MSAPIPSPIAWRPAPLIVFSILLHLIAIGVIAIDPPNWRWPLAAIIANHLLLTAIGLWPRSRSLGPNWTRLPAASSARNEVAITIDDGPDPDVTPKVLDLLDAHRVAATFFCVGSKVERHPELCRDMIRRGHAIENHSANHRWHFSLLGIRGMQREVEGAQRIVTATTGQAPLFFRAPAGLRNPLLEAALARIGLKLASWTRRGFDTKERDPELVLRRLLRGLARGDILLVHDGNAARTKAGEPVILVVLPRLLEAIRAAGLKPVTLRSALSL
jgi:peptidoglycan/xylan/chitin deacetylase (PgdA/CDA1 family)